MHEYMQMYAYMWTWLDTAMDCMQPCLESIAFLFATNCYVTPRNDSGVGAAHLHLLLCCRRPKNRIAYVMGMYVTVQGSC